MKIVMIRITLIEWIADFPEYTSLLRVSVYMPMGQQHLEWEHKQYTVLKAVINRLSEIQNGFAGPNALFSHACLFMQC